MRIGTVGPIQLYSSPGARRSIRHIHDKVLFQGGASHICSGLECVLIDLEVLGDGAAVVAFSLDRHRRRANVHIVAVRKRVIRTFLQHRASCHNRRLRLLRAAGISPVGNTGLHDCGVQPNGCIRKRDQAAIHALSGFAIHVLDIRDSVITDRVARINGNAITAVNANVANVTQASIRAFPKHDVARTCVLFTNRSAVVVVQARRTRIVGVDVHAANMVIYPVHKARAVEATVTIQVLATPYIRKADVLIGVYEYISKRRRGIISRTAHHQLRIRLVKLFFACEILNRGFDMSLGIRRRLRGIGARNRRRITRRGFSAFRRAAGSRFGALSRRCFICSTRLRLRFGIRCRLRLRIRIYDFTLIFSSFMRCRSRPSYVVRAILVGVSDETLSKQGQRQRESGQNRYRLL